MTDPTNALHREAMDLADAAAEASRFGHADDARRLALAALEKETAAALAIESNFDLEPSRSVLFRSAASLALECGDLRRAEQLIAAGLRGSPPTEIANELRDLFENVNFARHLALRGVELQSDEFQMSLEGPGVGFGVARSNRFVRRVRDLERLIFRTAERKRGQTFREVGKPKSRITEELELYLSVPRAASFAVTFKFGKTEQLNFPGIDFPRQVINDLLDCIEIINGPQPDALHERIPDDVYFQNFVSLARLLAPDGEEVRTVGFTASNHEGERRVLFQKPKPQLRAELRETAPSREVAKAPLIEIMGTLLEADAKSQKEGLIEVVEEGGKTRRIRVPRGMMRDIVKPMFEEQVIVAARSLGRDRYELESIDLAEEEPIS